MLKLVWREHRAVFDVSEAGQAYTQAAELLDAGEAVTLENGDTGAIEHGPMIRAKLVQLQRFGYA